MSQPTLFEIPPAAISRSGRLKDRLRGFKNAHDILTYRSPNVSRAEKPWCALLRAEEDRLADKDLYNCMADSCRIYDETHRIGYGLTERDAIIDLCMQQSIRWEGFV